MQSWMVQESVPPLKYKNPLIPLILHDTRGRNVQLENNNVGVAARADTAVDQGYVFTAHPILPGQTIVVQILATNPFYIDYGSLAFGLTSCNPATLKSLDLPDIAEEFLDRTEYWVVEANAAEGLQAGETLVFAINLDGEVRLSRNGFTFDTITYVDHTVALWAFVDIYGSTTKIRMLCDVPPLCFHSVHGEYINISERGSMARRGRSLSNGITFSSRPILVNEKVCLRVKEVSNQWIGTLSFGFTKHDPVTLARTLPPRALPDLTYKPGTWAMTLENNDCKLNDILHFYVNSSGNVHFGINGEDEGVVFSGVDTRSPLWALVDIYGKYSAVQIVHPTTQCQLRGNSPLGDKSLSGSMQSMTIDEILSTQRYQNSLVPLILHGTKGKNVQFVKDTFGVAVRTDATESHGYVFTARPIHPGQTIVVLILQIDSLLALNNSTLTFGLTSCDPDTLRSSDLPDIAEELLDRPEYWVVKTDAADELQTGDRLHFTLTFDGQVRLSRNGSTPVTIMHIDNTVTLWAFVDICGSTKKIRMGYCLPGTDPIPTPYQQFPFSTGQAAFLETQYEVPQTPSEVSIATQPSCSYQQSPPSTDNQCTVTLEEDDNDTNVTVDDGDDDYDDDDDSGDDSDDDADDGDDDVTIEETLPPIRYQNPVVPLILHRTKGRNVQFVNDINGVAVRTDTTVDQAYVFTANPFRPRHTIVVQILATESATAGSLAFGLTSCDPAILTSSDLPDIDEELYERPEYWVVKADAALGLQTEEELVFTLTVDGQVRLSRNGSTPVTIMHIDNTVTLWAFANMGGSTKKIRMLSSQPVIKPPPRQLQSTQQTQLTSEDSFTRQPNTHINRTDNQNSSAHQNIANQQEQLPTNHLNPNSAECNVPSSNIVQQELAVTVEEPTEAECTICCDNPTDSVLYACGHICMCYKCAIEVWKGMGGGKCPVCRTPIKDVIRTYRS